MKQYSSKTLSLYNYRKTFNKNFQLINHNDKSFKFNLIFKYINFTHTNFFILKKFICLFLAKIKHSRFDCFIFTKNYINFKFHQFFEVKSFFFFCFNFKIIPFFLTPINVFINDKKITFNSFLNLLNITFTRLEIIKYILKKICRHQIYKHYKLIENLIKIKCQL